MKNELVLKVCENCNATVLVMEDCNCENCGIKCCGENMKVLVPNSVEASFEKHIPTFEKVEDEIFVKVNHVMEKEHYIEWICMVNGENICMKKMYPEQNAETRFKYIPGSTIYSYCNKHGLWKTDVE